MTSDLPLVSIGMPLFNAERFVSKALDSLLQQDYLNFELIISDNCSTDSTVQICKDYAARNGRVQFYQSEENRGAAWNFKHVFELAKGAYFMWAAHDDLWDPNYISECVKALDAAPTVSLCCTSLTFRSADGTVIEEDHPNLDTQGLELLDRVRELIAQRDWIAIYGLFRTSALQRIRLGNTTWGNDVLLLLDILLQGQSMRIDSTRFHYRVIEKTPRDLHISIDPSVANRPLLAPHWEMVLGMLRIVSQSKLPPLLRFRVQVTILSGAILSPSTLQHHLRHELMAQFFGGSLHGSRRAIILSAPGAFWLNPSLFFNRGAWSTLARCLYPRPMHETTDE